MALKTCGKSDEYQACAWYSDGFQSEPDYCYWQDTYVDPDDTCGKWQASLRDEPVNPAPLLRRTMNCPKCDYPQYCGCNESCRERIPEGIKPYIGDGNFCSCAKCGFRASYDYWLDREYEIYKTDELLARRVGEMDKEVDD